MAEALSMQSEIPVYFVQEKLPSIETSSLPSLQERALSLVDEVERDLLRQKKPGVSHAQISASADALRNLIRSETLSQGTLVDCAVRLGQKLEEFRSTGMLREIAQAEYSHATLSARKTLAAIVEKVNSVPLPVTLGTAGGILGHLLSQREVTQATTALQKVTQLIPEREAVALLRLTEYKSAERAMNAAAQRLAQTEKAAVLASRMGIPTEEGISTAKQIWKAAKQKFADALHEYTIASANETAAKNGQALCEWTLDKAKLARTVRILLGTGGGAALGTLMVFCKSAH